MTNEFALVFAKHYGKFELVPFYCLVRGDYLPAIHRTVAVEPHPSGDSSYDGWLLYDDRNDGWFPEDLEWSGDEVDDLWAEFGDVPMNPETECIESDWLHFTAGTNREEIWHWFEETFDVRVADLMYGMTDDENFWDEDMPIQITFTSDDIQYLRQKFEIYDATELENAVWECIDTYMGM